jgi:hypothetical protein
MIENPVRLRDRKILKSPADPATHLLAAFYRFPDGPVLQRFQEFITPEVLFDIGIS